MKKTPTLEVKVFHLPIAEKETYKGKAEYVCAKNRLGDFDILPGHANFISLIFDRLSLKTVDKKTLSWNFERGVLEVDENKINIFLGL